MITIQINASKQYSVIIGSGLIKDAGKMIRKKLNAEKLVIISDSNVWPIYGEALYTSLSNQNYTVYSYIVSAGESSKNGNSFLEILYFLAEKQISRTDALIALGGGVVGDLTGFVAACYLRGIPYVQIPTTLLAAVDSSVGGKTAIDLPAGKNLAGAFYQPSLVLCDTATLSTLPEEIFLDGCAEVIKYAILFDSNLFSHLETYGKSFDRDAVIARCIELKRDVVIDDEFDIGIRQKLNLGHTIAHGIEACSNYSISHGRAVAIGTAIISRCAYKHNICPQVTSHKIHDLLKSFSLPVETSFSAENLFEAALSDKKRSGNRVNLIVPESIGNCRIHPIDVSELKSFIEVGLPYEHCHST